MLKIFYSVILTNKTVNESFVRKFDFNFPQNIEKAFSE